MCDDCKRSFVWANLEMVLEKGFDPERVEHSYAANEAVQYLMRVYETVEMEVGTFHEERERAAEMFAQLQGGHDDDGTQH